MDTKEITTVNFELPGTLVGQRLDGRFFIEKNLTDEGADAGGIGVVYLASDEKLMGKQVVVKILQARSLEHADLVRKFQHEKEALIRLDHPGIVRILDSGNLSDGNPFMVMEFIGGHSLRRELRTNNRIPLDKAAHIIASVMDALGAAHTKKVLHRDIKPENIMLTPQDGPDRIRLIDFGIARVGESQLAPATEVQRAIGTVLYIPPEQLIGHPHLTPAADIYSAAIVAYELITGKVPFDPRSVADMYQLEKDGVSIRPSQLRPEVPKSAEDLVLAALEFDAAKRPQNARAFGRDLAAALRSRLDDRVDGVFDDQMKTLASGRDEIATRDRAAVSLAPSRARGAFGWAAVLALLVVLIGGGTLSLIGYFYRERNNAASNVPLQKEGEAALTYFLTVQKMRNGRAFEQPFRSSGQEIFESGYKFAMHFKPAFEGFLYVFNEGKDTAGNPGFFLISPTSNVNNGDSRVVAGQEVVTAQNTFTGSRGTEVLWLVWSRERLNDLEAAWKSVTDKRQPAAAEYSSIFAAYQQKYQSSKPESTKDSVNQMTVIKGKGDPIVHRFELEHR